MNLLRETTPECWENGLAEEPLALEIIKCIADMKAALLHVACIKHNTDQEESCTKLVKISWVQEHSMAEP